MKTYKICFIGASGHWGYLTQGMTSLNNTEFTAFAPSFENENLTAFQNLEIHGKKGKFYQNYQDMLDAEQPDIISITPRYDLIAPITLEVVQRGIHVIAEKPLAFSLEKLDEIKEAVQKAGIRLSIMMGIRYEPAFFTAKKQVEAGRIGEPLLIWAQKSYRWGTRPEWYKKRETYGSTINWVGIHALDWARWVSGLEFREISASHANLIHPEFAGCQDIATVQAKLSNGALAVFNFDYLRPIQAKTHGDDRLRIAGSKGVLEVIGRENRLSITDEAGEQENEPLLTPPDFLADFINELEGKGPAIISLEDAFKITEIAIKATLAADTQRGVVFF
jgi:predicted dehydrogenase